MKKLRILEDGKTIEPIEIIHKSASLQIKTNGVVSFLFSHDRNEWYPWPETITCEGNHWEPLDELKISNWMKIVSTGDIESASLIWNIPIH